MSKNRDFETGDYVTVVGGKLTRNNGEETIDPSFKVGKVLYVGKWDMVILEAAAWAYPSTFVAKKDRCSHIKVNPSFAKPAAPEPPALGDMVLRHKGLKFGSDNAEAHVGVLMEISQSPGSRPKGKILVANELVEIEIADVIVLQRRDEK